MSSYLLTHLGAGIASNRANIWVADKSEDNPWLYASLKNCLKTIGAGASVDTSRFRAVNVNSTRHMSKEVLCAGTTHTAFTVDEVASVVAQSVAGTGSRF